MKVQLSEEGRLVYFVEYTQEEIDWVMSTLRWENKDDTEESLVFINHETGNIYTFSGIVPVLQNLNKYPIEVVNPPDHNLTRFEVPEDLLDGISLYGFQKASIAKALMHKRGLVVIPTGGGKSECMLGLLRYLKNEGKLKKGLVVVPSVGLADQFADRGYQRGFTKSELGVVHGAVKEHESDIVVAVINSISEGVRHQNPKVLKLIEDTNVLMYDETHHLRSQTYMDLAVNAGNAEYLLGYSGSPFIESEVIESSGDTLIWGLTGGPIFQISHGYLTRLGLLAKPVIHCHKTSGNMLAFRANFNRIYNNFIVKNSKRNKDIVSYTTQFAKLGFKTLVQVQRLEHAELLMKELSGVRAISVFGSGTGLVYNEYGTLVKTSIDYDVFRQQVADGMWDVVIGSQVLDEGFDLPSVGAIIMAGGGKSRIKLLQRLGRGLRRKKTGWNQVYVVDFNDRGHVWLHAQYKKRRKLYEEIEAQIVEDKYAFMNLAHLHAEADKNAKLQVIVESS